MDFIYSICILVLFYSILNREKKYLLLIKKSLPIMLCTFANDLLALKKCRISHIENLTSNQKFGYQAFNEYNAD